MLLFQIVSNALKRGLLGIPAFSQKMPILTLLDLEKPIQTSCDLEETQKEKTYEYSTPAIKHTKTDFYSTPEEEVSLYLFESIFALKIYL